MIEPRIYRAAFIPALVALVLTMFSLQSRPRPLPQGLAADVLFDGRLAKQEAARLVDLAPDRRPGGEGDRVAARLVRNAFRDRGFRVQPLAGTRFTHAGHRLQNVIATRVGRSPRQVVVVAARDADRVPDAAGSAASTAALLEFARVFEGRPSNKTLVLASVDGSTLGEVGTERLIDKLASPDLVDGVLVMSDLGAPRADGPLLQAWSNDSSRAGIGLQRTVADSIRQELDQPVGQTGTLGQMSHLSFPIGIGPQGPLLKHGYDAVRVSGSGDLPAEGDVPVARIDEDRLGGLGRATLRTASALDQAKSPPDRGPDSYVTAVSQVMPGWVLALLGVTLLLPALVASVDAFARARRRHEAVSPWLRWVGAWSAPFLAGWALAELLALTGATPSPPPAPVAPEILPLDGPALGVLGGVAAAMAIGWGIARYLAVKPDPALREPADSGAGVALCLVTSVAAMVLWLVNPFAGLLTVPAVHLWLLATVTDPAPPRRARVAMVAAGALPALIVSLYYMVTLGLGPVEAAWYLLLLVTGHQVGPVPALVACVLLGCFLGAVELVLTVPEAPEEEPGERGPAVYGPGAYAGPGSLGGTQSALRR
ncbi:MAG TPA: hypothetical protein VGF25_16015 [Thermoleophilaceae bacterium]